MKYIWLKGMAHEETRGRWEIHLIQKPWRKRTTWEKQA